MMRGTILLLVAVAAMGATPLIGSKANLAKWNQFKKAHGKSYASIQEETSRFNIFTQNLRFIDQHNAEFKAGKHTYDVGLNKYADMTNEEFRTIMNGYKRTGAKPAAPIHNAPTTGDLPASVDWRPLGYVTEVKDQGQCGSCWAFSATGGLEGQHFNKTGELVSLSEQDLVDCGPKKDGLFGCGGGQMDGAFKFIKADNGVDTEASYPYTAKDGKCKFDTANIGATDNGYVDIKSGDEKALESAIATVGPISVAIDASHLSFQLYKSGVYYEPKCSTTQLDHGVLAVGYDTTDDGTKYYTVKNSWGTSYGTQGGYILMSRERNNNCGIATDASYPTV
jgi:cathepsin L